MLRKFSISRDTGGLMAKFTVPVFSALVLSFALAGCGQVSLPHLKPLPAETRALLAKNSMTDTAPIYIRIFKQESELELWKAKDDGRYYHFKTYPICNWSGKLGPKIRQGDKQSPEGFYYISKGQMNPNSKFHLSFNMGFPNSYDRAHGRTGAHLMVHGDCRSKGCYAMTDALIEDIYLLAREAFRGGQEKFPVHAFPFRMTKENMKRHRKNKWIGFWRDLKEGYDHFEIARTPPKVNVCQRRYLINASFFGGKKKIDPSAPCPAYEKIAPSVKLRGSRFDMAKKKLLGKPLTEAQDLSIMTSSTGLTAPPRSFRDRVISNSTRLDQ